MGYRMTLDRPRYVKLDIAHDLALAELMTDYRRRARMTQLKAEIASGVGRKSISAIERARQADRAPLALIVALLRVYRVSLSQFGADLEELAKRNRVELLRRPA